jgi:3D (Asp-Asp-Asp) domain-containing protein
MVAGRGVVAVDPSVIPLYTRLYVPGYGTAIAGDTGGAVKGRIVDLGFPEDVTNGWGARYVDVYLLGPVPAGYPLRLP